MRCIYSLLVFETTRKLNTLNMRYTLGTDISV